MRIHSTLKNTAASAALAVLALYAFPTVFAASHHGGGHGPSMDGHGAMPHSGGHDHSSRPRGGGAAIGEPGKPSDVSRTIDIVIADNRFTPESIAVRKGETVRFRVTNKGEFVHEFSIGTAAMHKAHQKQMAMMVEHGVLAPDKIHRDRMKTKMPDGHTMDHNDPNSVLLEPGKSAEVVWKFSTDAELEFACNMPGHYESGMTGPIKIH